MSAAPVSVRSTRAFSYFLLATLVLSIAAPSAFLALAGEMVFAMSVARNGVECISIRLLERMSGCCTTTSSTLRVSGCVSLGCRLYLSSLTSSRSCWVKSICHLYVVYHGLSFGDVCMWSPEELHPAMHGIGALGSVSKSES